MTRKTSMLTTTVLLLSFAASTVAADLVAVNYTHNLDDLQGFKSTPEGSSSSGPFPAIVIIPDWDGVNEYEQTRATMIADALGYVGFAADIYGADKHIVNDITERRTLATLYRSNATLFSERIQAAVELVKTFPEVDAENVALIGYCFGGTGVLTYALMGMNDVQAVVSFHGGLGSLPPVSVTVEPKVLVLSGGADDAATDIMDLETTLDTANSTWEITRYSNIEHAFTVFSDDRYNKWADEQSWGSMKNFLAECFGEITYTSEPPAATMVTPVTYTSTVDGTMLQSYIALPDASFERPRPAVIIVPDWDGVNEYEQQRATLLAELGYVGFAADIYGADLQTGLNQSVRIEQAGKYRDDPELFVQRMERAIDQVKMFDDVDVNNIAVIGYCFGGTGVIELAMSGNDDVKVVASFHGGHRTVPTAQTDIAPYVLVLSGGDDDAHGNQTVLEASLNGGDADWEITRYSGVLHGYTKWGDSRYNLNADYRSWKSMMTVFEKLLFSEDPMPTGAPSTSNAPGLVSWITGVVALVGFACM